jgi:hypothetical protein
MHRDVIRAGSFLIERSLNLTLLVALGFKTWMSFNTTKLSEHRSRLMTRPQPKIHEPFELEEDN